jgi:hypothetical protein
MPAALVSAMGREWKLGFMFACNKKQPLKLNGDVLLSFGILFAMMA